MLIINIFNVSILRIKQENDSFVLCFKRIEIILVCFIGSFSELSKSLDSLLNDVGSHRDSTYTSSNHGDEVTGAHSGGGRDRRSIHALGE